MLKKIRSFLLTNQDSRQTILKNTFWLTLGEIIIRILKSFLIVIAIHKLTPEKWGLFSYVFATVTLLASFTEFGFSPIITKKALQNSDEDRKYLGTIIGLKVFFLIIVFLLILLLPIFDRSDISFLLYLTLGLTTLGYSTREIFLSFIRAKEIMEAEASVKIIDGIFSLVIGLLLVSIYQTPLALAVGYLSGSIGSFVFALLRSKGSGIRKSLLNFRQSMMIHVLREIGVVGILALFNTIILNIDTILLGNFRSGIEVGFYAAAQRIIQFVYIIPSLILTALFPFFVRMGGEDLQLLGEKSVRIMAGLSTIFLPFVALFIIFSKEIIQILFGSSYLPMLGTLAILSISTLFNFSNIILIGISIATNKQIHVAKAYLWGVIINIILNIVLIKAYGSLGSAIAILLTQAIILFVSLKNLAIIKIWKWLRSHAIHLLFFPLVILSTRLLIFKNHIFAYLSFWLLYVLILIISPTTRKEIREFYQELPFGYKRLTKR
jgi:PST family polysaccharide transporter